MINVSLMNLRKSLITDEPHLLRRVYHMKNNRILIGEVKILREQYLHIGEAVQLLTTRSAQQPLAWWEARYFMSRSSFMIMCIWVLITRALLHGMRLIGPLTICYSGNLVRMILDMRICQGPGEENWFQHPPKSCDHFRRAIISGGKIQLPKSNNNSLDYFSFIVSFPIRSWSRSLCKFYSSVFRFL